MKGKVALALGSCAVLVAAVLLVNTLRFTSRQVAVDPVQPLAVDADGAADRLAGAIRFQTVSHQDPANMQADQFLGLHRYLEQTYPRGHVALIREVVGDHGLLYTWTGSDASLKPV